MNDYEPDDAFGREWPFAPDDRLILDAVLASEEELLFADELARETGVSRSEVESSLGRFVQSGFVLPGMNGGWVGSLCAEQFVERQYRVSARLADSARQVDDLNGREALIRSGVALRSAFREALLAGVGAEYVEHWSPTGFPIEITEDVAFDFFGALVSASSRLELGVHPVSPAEQLMTIQLWRESVDRVENSDLEREAIIDATTSLNFILTMFPGPRSVLDLCEIDAEMPDDPAADEDLSRASWWFAESFH